jgi:hypothetical protein
MTCIAAAVTALALLESRPGRLTVVRRDTAVRHDRSARGAATSEHHLRGRAR